MRVLVLGSGLSGLAATECLLDAGAEVTVIDAFPVAGGRVASFDVGLEVAGLVPGDVVEHGLHAWFQHYHGVFGLMRRAGLRKPEFAGRGIYFFHPDHGHYAVEGGPGAWLVRALDLPVAVRGPRVPALSAFGRLIGRLSSDLGNPARTDQITAAALLARSGVSQAAIDYVFRPCMYSLTSLPLEQLSALELLRWMSNILPDPRIRCLRGGGTAAMAAPICAHLAGRGADFRFGVEVHALQLRSDGRVALELAQAPDRTGVRHLLVRDFAPAEPPDPEDFDAIVCTLPWERLVALSPAGSGLRALPALGGLSHCRNVHPMTIRLWFEQPIEHAREHYLLCSGTLFDVLRPTREPERYPGIHLIDLLIENVETHLPEFVYRGERLLSDDEARPIEARVLADLERVFPGQITGNRVARRFYHTREGVLAAHPGSYMLRPPQYIGLRHFVLAGDYTRQPFGMSMEGAVQSGRLAAESLLAGRQVRHSRAAFAQTAYSVRSLFEWR